MRFCDWLQSIPTEPHFTNRPEFEFFAGMTDDEMLAAEQELIRRVAASGTYQDVDSSFIDFVAALNNHAQNDR